MIDYHPFADAVLDDPLPYYRQLRDEAPAFYMEEFDCWFLSRFADIWRAEMSLKDFTVTRGVVSYQLLNPPEVRNQFADAATGVSLSVLDPPAHTPARKVLAPAFAPLAASGLEEFTRARVTECIDSFIEQGECDIVGDLAMKISVRVACTISGVPLEKADWLVETVNALFQRDPGDEEEFSPNTTMSEFLLDFVAERRKNPGEAAVDRLIAAELDGRPLRDDEIASHLSVLLIGGTETLPKVLASAAVRLWENPDQRSELRAHPELVKDAFWEALRFDMPTQMLGRSVVREIEFHGHTMTPGQAVLFLFASANRDEREFDEPDRFDIHRKAPRILTFGHGTHRCIGANMAQMEGRVMLEEILKRLPDYEVDLSQATRFRSEFFAGYSSLKVRFEPGPKLGAR